MKAFSMLASFALFLFLGAVSAQQDGVFVVMNMPPNFDHKNMTRKQVKTLNLYMKVAIKEFEANFPARARNLRGGNGGHDEDGRNLHGGHPHTCTQCLALPGYTKLMCQQTYQLCRRRTQYLPTNAKVLQTSSTDPMTGKACSEMSRNATITEIDTLAKQDGVLFATGMDPQSANTTIYIC
jgi:hypothetical protein